MPHTHWHALLLVLLAAAAPPRALAQAPQLALTFCSAARSASQLWAFDAENATLVLASNGQCIDILAWGTSPGSEAYTAPCHHDDRDPTHQNQEWAPPAAAPPGAPLVQTMAKLPLDACGPNGAVPGALLTLCAAQGAGSFWLNASSAGAPGALIHSASGLCVDAAGPPSGGSLEVVLNACSDAPAVALRQTFVLAANGAPDFVALATPSISGSPLCLTASAGAGAGIFVSACAPPSGGIAAAPQSQSFVLDAQGRLATGFAPLVADAGPNAPFFRGAATMLSAPSAASVFALNSSGHAAGTGRLVHAASGLCLDAGGVPTSHGCLDRAARGLPFCDPTLPTAQRIADLVSRMTLAEKIGLTGADLSKDGSCDTKDAGVPRLGVPPMQWLVETNSMAASACYNGSCATSFPSAQNLASSMNRSVWSAKGVVVSTEMRALNNLQWHRADGIPDSLQSLSGFGPDINQPRDPRNGRAGELPSEDRLVMAEYAVRYVHGCQDSADPRYISMITGLKHYAGYSLETGRMGSKGNFSVYDLFDTYLPPFEAGFVEGGSAGSMCSYISLAIGEGASPVPACADDYLLNTLVREYWNRPDATHTSDCGAVSNMADENHYVKNHTLAAAAFLNGGADLNSEYTVPKELPLALALGLVSVSTVEAAISRTLGHRFRVGMLDPLEQQPAEFFERGQADIGAASSAQLVQEATAQGIVLASNAAGALPLRKGARVALLGPLGSCDRCLMGDYYADMVCVGGGFACVPTLAAALTAANVGGSVTAIMGVSVGGNDSSWGAAIAAVAAADVVVLALGTDNNVAGEGTDLGDIGLPGVQSQFGVAVLAAARAAGNKPVVLLMVSAFPTAFDDVAAAAPAAVVLAYAPTFGAPAIAAQLFGDTNRWGRAVMTVYPRAYQSAVSLFDFGMTPVAGSNPGRGYRYYDGSAGAPLVRFGQGSSYSTFSTACAGGFEAPGSDFISVNCNISNVAGPDGDQVLMVYHRVSGDIVARIGGAHPVPLSSLADFERFSLPAGGAIAGGGAVFQLRASRSLALVDATGASVLYPGLHFLDVWDGGSFNATIAIEVPGAEAVVLRRPPPPPPAAASTAAAPALASASRAYSSTAAPAPASTSRASLHFAFSRSSSSSSSSSSLAEAPRLPAAPYVADVTAFGAKGDGVTLDSAAVAAAIAAVAAHGGGVLLFPTGTFLMAPQNYTSDLEIRLVNATLLAVTDRASWPIVAPLPSYGRGRDFPGPRYGAFVQLNNLTRVRIVGEGGAEANFVDGQGSSWWDGKRNRSLLITPGHLVETMWSSDVEIEGVTLVDSPFWTTHLYSSTRLHVHDVRVRAPGDSPNTDGFDPDSSANVLIERVDVSNGDDCIAIKSGWDSPGVAYGVPSVNITFRDSVCDSTKHAGNCIAIGSEMSGGVDTVVVSNITCVNSGTLLDVKSSLGRGGYIRNVSVADCIITSSVGTAIRVADDYGDSNGPVNRTLVPLVGGVTCARISSAPGAVVGAAGYFEGLGNSGAASGEIVGIVLSDISFGAAPAGSWRCVNVSGTSARVSPAPCAQLQG